jgi:hypothetical protein
MVYGEPLAVNAPVVSNSSPLTTVNPGVLVVNVTGAMPEVAVKTVENVALLSAVVEPDAGGP